MAQPGTCYRFLSVLLASFFFGLAVLLFLIFGSHKDEPTEHYQGGPIELSMGPLISKGSIVPWAYYWYPFPRGPGFRTTSQAFIDAFASLYRNGDSGFRNVRWEEDPRCYAQSTLTNDTEVFYNTIDLDRFSKAIRDGYRIQPYVAGVRMVSPHPDGGWWWGYDIGRVIGSHVLLYNHVDFYIDVDSAGRIVKAVAMPRHTDSIHLCSDPSDVPNHRLSPVRWSYTTHVRVTSNSYRDMNKIYDKMLGDEDRKIGYFMFGMTVLVFLLAASVLSFLLVRICRKNRFDLDELHDALAGPSPPVPLRSDSISISLVDMRPEEVIPRPSQRGEGALLDRRTADNDEDVDIDIDIDIESITEESVMRERRSAKYLLTQHHSTILGKPKFPRVLATLVACGIQLLVVFVTALIVSLWYQHSWNNTYQTITVILLPTTGAVSGFIYKRLMTRWQSGMVYRGQRYQQLQAPRAEADNARCGLCDHLIVIIAITLPLYVVFFMVTSMQMLYHDAAVVAGLFFLLLAFMVINAIMYMTGINLATAFPPAVRPFFRMDLPDYNESCLNKLSLSIVICVTVAGIQGFGAVYIGDMLLSTPWNTKVKQELGFVIVFLLLWVISGAILSVLATYCSVIYVRQPRWHWLPYCIGIVTGAMVFVFTLSLTMDRNTYNDEWNYIAITVLLFVASVLVGVVCGAVNWLATDVFWQWPIYGNIVIKD